mgnify:CR=1 FL=1
MLTFFTYCCVGAVVGIMAGLLGVGGGCIIIPILVYTMSHQGVSHEHVMHLALGTSLACIIFSSISSLKAHHDRGAVHWDIVRRITTGIVAGTFFGSFFASILSTKTLTVIFALFLLFVSAQLLMNRKPAQSRDLPGIPGMFSAGSGIGFVSSLVGIGGGSLSVPFFVWCNLSIHHAIGTSAAFGLPIAVAGTIGYIFNGWGAPNLPDFSIGFVYLPALFGIAAISVFTAPIGVKIAHSLPVDKLKRIFAFLLMIVGIKMLFDIL